MLPPLINLLTPSNVTLNIFYNQVKNMGASSMLSPLANMFNLSSLALNFNDNRIGDTSA